MSKQSSAQHKLLRRKFTITPKTATLLMSAGYKDYRDLADTSPNQIVTQFAALPGISLKLAQGYKRPARRIVWLATQPTPEEDAKICKDWTNKGLAARGMWVDGFDDLSGRQIDELYQKAVKTVVKKEKVDRK